MTVSFNPHYGLIQVTVEVAGPSGLVATVQLALDTGATHTLVNTRALTRAGYSCSQTSQQVPVATAGGMVPMPRLRVQRLTALGQDRSNFLVTAHNLPASSLVDGLLGLDFVRGQTLKIDFKTGLIDLT